MISIKMMMVDRAMPSTPRPKIFCETALPAKGSKALASWKLSRFTSMAASCLSDSLGCSNLERALL